jgi:hypothetical protein
MTSRDRRTASVSSGEERYVRARNTSVSSSKQTQTHTPLNPSHLRESHLPSTSPENRLSQPPEHGEPGSSQRPEELAHEPEIQKDGIHPTLPNDAHTHSGDGVAGPVEVEPIFNTPFEPDLRARLLTHKNWDAASGCGSEHCQHGTFSPRPGTNRSYGSFASDISRDGFGGRYPGALGDGFGSAADSAHGILGDAIADGIMGGGQGNKMSTTRFLAKRHGVKNHRMM